MERREFLLGTAAALAASRTALAAPAKRTTMKLKYGPHPGMFKAHAPGGVLDEIKFCADQGFRGWEDNGMKGRPPEEQEKIGKEVAKHGMEMGIILMNRETGFRTPGALTSGKAEDRDAFLKEVRDIVDIAKRVNTKVMTSLVGNIDPKLPLGYQFANVTDCLRRASDILEPHGLVMVFEPLNIYENHPGFFVHTNPEMYALMKAVRSPSCKLLYDFYHSQISEGHLLYNFDRCFDEIGYVQTGDVPGRKEPGTGETNYRNCMQRVFEKGYTGVVGMEHGMAGQGKAGEMAVIQAYRDADNFPVTKKT